MKITSIPNNSVFKSFEARESSETKKTNMPSKQESKFHPAVAVGSVLGTLAPLVALNSLKKGALPLNEIAKLPIKGKFMEFAKRLEIDGMKDILITSMGAISGSLIGGLLTDKNRKNDKPKVKEAVFEYMNILVPTCITASLLKFTENKMPSIPSKIFSAVVGIGLGLPIGAKISNALNRGFIEKDKAVERKIGAKDCLVHADDIVEMLVLAKVPLVKQIHLDKALAGLYALSGYEVGTKKATVENEGRAPRNRRENKHSKEMNA